MNAYGPQFKHHRTKADHVYPAGRGGKSEMRRYWKRVARQEGKREIEAAPNQTDDDGFPAVPAPGH